MGTRESPHGDMPKYRVFALARALCHVRFHYIKIAAITPGLGRDRDVVGFCHCRSQRELYPNAKWEDVMTGTGSQFY